MAGFDEVRELVIAGAETGNLIGALSDGPGLDDLDEAIATLTSLAAAVTGVGEAIEYLKAGLTDEEVVDLRETFKSRFDLDNDASEELVEDAVKVAIVLGEFVAKRVVA